MDARRPFMDAVCEMTILSWLSILAVSVILPRADDSTTASAIRFWIAERIRLGLNHSHDPILCLAASIADRIEQFQAQKDQQI